MHRATAAIFVICTACVIVFFAGFLGLYAGETGEVFKITPDQHDFGTIDEGKAAIVTAAVENIGNASVQITNVRTS